MALKRMVKAITVSEPKWRDRYCRERVGKFILKRNDDLTLSRSNQTTLHAAVQYRER